MHRPLKAVNVASFGAERRNLATLWRGWEGRGKGSVCGDNGEGLPWPLWSPTVTRRALKFSSILCAEGGGLTALS